MNAQLKVLVADDNELMQTVMKTLFDRLLHLPEIVVCANLKDTFTLLKQRPFDFLLLDINMPGGDSDPQSVREMLAIQPQLKICMFTGNDKGLLSHLYTEAGAIGFIQKDHKIPAALEEVLKSAFN
ncbi:response regulator transcription factor [Pedobacter frigidisoli]|uniref:response regulator n=1 Tax=Pedobacter frigidisoli TaxID=2530455 RepID=UPI002931D612|nr:response regulator transcription factor [Pedobacter frigidisoli]